MPPGPTSPDPSGIVTIPTIIGPSSPVHFLASIFTVSWRIAVSESVLGECLAGQGRFEAAEKLLTESYKAIEKSLKPDDKRRKEALTRVINMYESWKKPERDAEYRALAASESNVVPR